MVNEKFRGGQKCDDARSNLTKMRERLLRRNENVADEAMSRNVEKRLKKCGGRLRNG